MLFTSSCNACGIAHVFALRFPQAEGEAEDLIFYHRHIAKGLQNLEVSLRAAPPPSSHAQEPADASACSSLHQSAHAEAHALTPPTLAAAAASATSVAGSGLSGGRTGGADGIRDAQSKEREDISAFCDSDAGTRVIGAKHGGEDGWTEAEVEAAAAAQAAEDGRSRRLAGMPEERLLVRVGDATDPLLKYRYTPTSGDPVLQPAVTSRFSEDGVALCMHARGGNWEGWREGE